MHENLNLKLAAAAAACLGATACGGNVTNSHRIATGTPRPDLIQLSPNPQATPLVAQTKSGLTVTYHPNYNELVLTQKSINGKNMAEWCVRETLYVGNDVSVPPTVTDQEHATTATVTDPDGCYHELAEGAASFKTMAR